MALQNDRKHSRLHKAGENADSDDFSVERHRRISHNSPSVNYESLESESVISENFEYNSLRLRSTKLDNEDISEASDSNDEYDYEQNTFSAANINKLANSKASEIHSEYSDDTEIERNTVFDEQTKLKSQIDFAARNVKELRNRERINDINSSKTFNASIEKRNDTKKEVEVDSKTANKNARKRGKESLVTSVAKTTLSAGKGINKIAKSNSKSKSVQEGILNEFKDSVNRAKGVFLSLPVLVLVPIFVVVVMIILMIFNLDISYNLMPLEDAVYLTNQNYKARLISEKTEIFGLDGGAVNYRGISVSWKQILCYWYVYGCDVGFSGVSQPTFYENMDSSVVRDMVANTELQKEEMDFINDAFNAINTIITYPETNIVSYTFYQSAIGLSESEIEQLVNEGYYYDPINQEILLIEESESLTVDIERKTAYEAAQASLTRQSNYEYILEHIDRCMRCIDEDDPSLEPVFYNMWHYIIDQTTLTNDGRDLIAKEAVALWIMCGCNGGDLPISIIEPMLSRDDDGTVILKDKNGDDIGDVYLFEYRFYQATGSNYDEFWDLYVEIPHEIIENNGSIKSLIQEKYQMPIQHETDTVPFLDLSNGYGWSLSCEIIDEEYSYSKNIVTRRPISGIRNPRRILLHEGMNWQDYSYKCIGCDWSGAWCDAFLNAMAQNMYPGGCFFTYNRFFIDNEHSGWEEWNPENDDFEPSFDWDEVSRVLEGISVSNFLVKISDLCSLYEQYFTAVNSFNYFNELELRAETDFYRINLMSSYSTMYTGLEDHYTNNGNVFRPVDIDSSGYFPSDDDEDTAYLLPLPNDSFGSQSEQTPSNMIYDGSIDMYLPSHDGSMNDGFVTNAGVDNSGYHIGHLEGWYAPILDVSCKYGDNLSLDEAYMEIGMGYYQVVHGWDDAFANWIISLGDTISDLFNRASTDMTLGDYLNRINRIKMLMYYKCALFGEFMEETQSLFVNQATCTYNLNWYYGNGMAFAPEEAGDLRSLETGDIVFFDYISEEAGVGDSIIDHTGLIIGVNGNTFYTIEGNSSNTVSLHSYLIDDTSIASFVDVNYGAND